MKQNGFDAFFKAAEKDDKEGLERMGREAASRLSPEQREKIEKAMSDPDFLSSLLSSPGAKEIIKKLQGGK